MSLTEDELWRKLNDYDVYKVQGTVVVPGNIFEKRSYDFMGFIENMNRALFPYPFICYYSMEKEPEYYFIEMYDSDGFHFLIETVMINLVTALEVYLKDIFKRLATEIKIEELDMSKFIKFIEEFKIKDNYFKALKKHGNHSMHLSEVIPRRMDFQQKNKSKIAFNLFSIYLPRILDKNQKIWNRIFGNSDGYIKIRNNLLHTGSIYPTKKYCDLNIELINNATLDIANFVNCLDSKILLEYPEMSAYNVLKK